MQNIQLMSHLYYLYFFIRFFFVFVFVVCCVVLHETAFSFEFFESIGRVLADVML